MKSAQRDNGSRHSTHPEQFVREKGRRNPVRDGIDTLVNDSPLMAAQRKKLQSLFGTAAQLPEEPAPAPNPNHTGLPDKLKSGIENLSGLSMDHVQVHYNSSKPAQLNALAYAQGSDIHLAPGQEQHLPHEAWHVVQQAQGRVQPTMQMTGDLHQIKGTAPPIQGRWPIDDMAQNVAREIERKAREGRLNTAFKQLLETIAPEEVARFSATFTAYRNAGKLSLVTTPLWDTWDDQDKNYDVPEILDEIDGHANETLREKFGGRNVIIAGETHDDLQTEAMETHLLPVHNIGVKYEPDTIVTTTDERITPDPPAYRLLFFIEQFYEALLSIKGGTESYESCYDTMHDAYNRYIQEFSNHLQPESIEDSLTGLGNINISYDRLEGLKRILYDTLDLVETRNPKIFSTPLIQNNARYWLETFDALKPEHNKVTPIMGRLRSNRMYEALQHDLLTARRTVYKVGDRHVNDIRAAFGQQTWVLDEAEYKQIFRL